MKTLHLTIITCLFTITLYLVSWSSAHAIPSMSPQEEYANSDTIVIGKIISAVPFSPTHMKYDVQVEQYLKNPQPEDKIVMIAEGTNKTQTEQGRGPDTVFAVGDRALLFLKQDQGNYVAWWFSRHTDVLCNPAPTQDDLNSLSLNNSKFSNVPAYSQLHIGATNSSSYLFQTGQPVMISFDAWNRHFTNQTFDVAFDIKNETSRNVIFHDTKQVQLKACIGHQTISTRFIPKTHGAYEADVSFDNSGMGTTFEILDNFSSVSLDHIPISAPLKQVMSGVAPKDVQCWEGLQLIFKTQNNHPACVKPDTATKLVERGWTKMILVKKGITINSYTPISNDTKKQSEAIDNVTYLSQTVDEWKNKTHEQLNAYYEKYKDKFYTELGSFLIKDEMKKELERQNIQNIHDDFKVFPGISLDSLPPMISYDAVVNATDGNSYLLLGGVSANKIESIKITKLAFDKDALNSLSTGKKPSYANPFAKAHRIVISDQEGIKSPVEPYNLELDMDHDKLVTFYNNSTVPIRIQPYGSGLTVDEGGLGWKSKVFGPNEMVTIQFNKTGYYEWDARSPPKESENWWASKGGGQIVVFSQSHDNSTSQEKPKMAQVFVSDSDIPWSSTGLNNYGNLEISLYESVYYMIPDAQKYYTARAMQLIPFDVPIIVSSPSFITK